MKRFSGYALTLLGLATTSCMMTHKERPQDQNVLTETYTHRYGVEVTADDWSTRGQTGKVTSNLANGVVVTKTYEAGVLEGETCYTFPHQSAVQKVEIYKEGELTQETSNYPAGTPQTQTQYRTPTSKVVYNWYENGTPLSSEEYENDLLVSGQYYNPDHQVEATVNEKQGTRINRDQYGIVQSTQTVENGQVALQTEYHANNAPKAIVPYSNGKIDGTLKTYLPGGEPNTIETWSNGNPHGETTLFLNGEKYSSVPYENGQKHGVEQRYRDGSILVQEVNWENGNQHGPTTSYVDGTVTTDWYYQGNPVSKVKYDAQMSHQR